MNRGTRSHSSHPTQDHISLILIIKVFNFSDILRMKCSVPLFLLLHTRVILGDYCEPSCECEEEPLISVKCLNANLQVCSLKNKHFESSQKLRKDGIGIWENYVKLYAVYFLL